jgi:lipid II:glycine glycyltransferase (peptidoglycan interpeptide bridge formation enzyme)
VNASFALFWEALEHFAARGLKWLLLGAGSGSTARADDGLSRFKRGWATTTRTAYLCGAIFDPQTYAALAQARNIPETKYFPAYRAGEFA